MSELISSFIEHSGVQDFEPHEPTDNTHNSHSAIPQTMDLYTLLLHKPLNTHHDNAATEPLSTDNLGILNSDNDQLTTIAPTSTINPRELNSHGSGSISSTNSEFDNVDDNSSSSEEESGTLLYSSTLSATTPRPRNWSMNDEFNNAINTWLKENDRLQKRNSISHIDPTNRHSVRPSLLAPRSTHDASDEEDDVPPTTTSFHRTSVTKRRKSESHIHFPRTSITHPAAIPSDTATETETETVPTTVSPTTTSTAATTTTTTTTTTTSTTASSVASSVQPQCTGDEEEEKPFRCNSCPKAFRRSEHLKRHVRSVHSNVRPFPCKFCEKKFSRSDNLAQHLRTHNKH